MSEPLRLPMNDPAFARQATTLVERVNGFAYQGDRTEAVIDTLVELRKDPELARRLLAAPLTGPKQCERTEWCGKCDFVNESNVVLCGSCGGVRPDFYQLNEGGDNL